MKYLFLVCTDGPITATRDELDVEPWLDETERRNARITGERLRPATDATTVRVREGQTLVTDGPYAETKEQMGGFDIIECKDLDEAIELASMHPIAKFGMIEIRPFWVDGDVPAR